MSPPNEGIVDSIDPGLFAFGQNEFMCPWVYRIYELCALFWHTKANLP